jgi:hypothetical protein
LKVFAFRTPRAGTPLANTAFMLIFRRIAILLSFSLPFTLTSGCTSSENLSSKGQLIECQVGADGTVSECAPTDTPTGDPGSCIDIDDDGDGDAHDEAEDDEDGVSSFAPETEGDDDGDGIMNEDDCDELPGGDSDDDA